MTIPATATTADKLSSYYDNPTVAAWAANVVARGGKTIPTGYPYAPDKGAPAGWWPDATKPGGKRWELAPLNVRVAIGYERKKDAAAIGAGELVEKIEAGASAVGLDKGITGVIGKALGIPHGPLLVMILIAGAVVGYGALVQIGVVPPIRKVLS